MSKPTWRDTAACRGQDPDQFHDDRMFPVLRAQFCGRCPVRNDCLAEAIRNREAGLWGGTSERARAAMMRGRPRATCPSCRGRDLLTMAGVGDELAQACRACALSWPVLTAAAKQAPATPRALHLESV